MLRPTLIATLFLTGTLAHAGPTLLLDFEGIEALEQIGRFEKGAFLARPGYGGSEQCVSRRVESTWCQIGYVLPRKLTLTEGSRIKFAHRVLAEGKANYIGCYIYTTNDKVGLQAVPTGPDWQVSEVDPIGARSAGHSNNRDPIAVGDVVERIALYGRLREHGEQSTYLDDISLTIPGEEPIELTPLPLDKSADKAVRAPPLREGELFSYDFEDGREQGARFAGGELVSPGHDSEHAWTISGDVKFLELEFECDFVLRPNMYLEVDSKVLTETGHRLYIGLYLIREDDKKRLNSSISSARDWEPNASRDLTLWSPAGHSEIKERGVIGERYTKCVLYSKVAEAAPQTMIVDNLRLVYEGASGPREPLSGFAHRSASPKTIDADLSDWREIDATAALVIGEASHAHRHSWYQGPGDASALAYLLHDEDALHVAFVVSDDYVRNPYSQPDEIYQGDCCVLAIGPAFPTEDLEYSRAYMFSPGDFLDAPPLVHLARGTGGTTAKVAAQKTDFGYVIEASIPAEELGFIPNEGAEIAVEAMLYDADNVTGPAARESIFTWASVTDRYAPREAGRVRLVEPYVGAVEKPPGTVLALAVIQEPLTDRRVFAVRKIEKTIAEAGVPLGAFFSRDDVPQLREKVKDGRPAACADVLLKTCALYLETVRPRRWDFAAIDEPTAKLIEKYLVRLSFAYILTEDSRFAELARRIALKTCELDWPDGDAHQRLIRGVECVLDWTGNALTNDETALLGARLPGEGGVTALPPPVESVPLEPSDWLVKDGDQFGVDTKLAASMGPPASRYAYSAAQSRDAGIQWLGERIFETHPSKSDAADEVWTIIFHDSSIAAERPASYSDELAQQAVDRRNRRLAELIDQHRRGPWLPFERDTKQPIRDALIGAHPRLLSTPERAEEMLLRGAGVPDSLWRPGAFTPHTPAPPNRRGNSGGPGYALLNLAGSYLATGQDFYAEDAVRTMLRVCEYPHWGGHNHLPADTDLDAGALLFGLGVAYDTFYECMTPDQRAIIREKLVKQARRMYDAHHARGRWAWDQNHTYIDNGGLWCTAVALYDEVPEARDWYDFGVRVIKNGMYVLNGTDGAFYEGISYWNYGMAMHFVPFLGLFRTVTGVDTFGYFEWLEKDKQYLLHTLLPGGKHQLNLGDVAAASHAGARMTGKLDVMLAAASEYQDPEARGLAEYFHALGGRKGTDRLWPLLFWDAAVAADDPRKTWPPHHHFDDLDIVCLRTGWDDDAAHFAMRCGPAPGHRGTGLVTGNDPPDWSPGTGHVHPDLNSFLIFDHGEHLAVDPGYTVLKRTRNHNTIAVDDGGQIGDGQPWPRFEPWDRFGRIAGFFPAPDAYYYVRGEAGNGYQAELALTRFDRHVMMAPDAASDATYFVIHDVLESAQPHRYEWLLHSDAEPAINDGQRYVVSSGKRALTAHLVWPSGLRAKTEAAKIAPHPGSEHTAIRCRRLSLTPGSASANQEFLAVLTLHPAGASGPQVSAANSAVKIAGPGWTDIIAITGSAGEIESDGHHALVRVTSDDVVRWGVIDAKQLTWRGKLLLRSSAGTAAAGVYNDDEARMTVEPDDAGDVAVYSPFTPESCLLDGEPAQFRYDQTDELTRLTLPAGRHRIVLRARR